MFFSILIASIGALSLLLLVKIKRYPQKHAHIPFVEVHPDAKFRLLEVMQMSDEMVQETIQFVMDNYGDDTSRIPAPTVERSGNTVRLKLDAKLCLSGFASWVNSFMYGRTQDEVYQVHGCYPIATAKFDGKQMRNTALFFYTPKELTPDDVSNVFFKTKKGRRYCYNLGYGTIHRDRQAYSNHNQR